MSRNASTYRKIQAVLMVAAVLAGSQAAADQGDTVSAKSVQPPGTERRAELVHMVRQDCGSCHGLTMKGGLGPALLPSALKDKDPEGLKYTILYGRPGTPMPPWKDFVSDAEAAWIVETLLHGLPDAH